MDQTGLVSAVDVGGFHPGAERAAAPANLERAPVRLGVDHPDVPPRHRGVVDVRLGQRPVETTQPLVVECGHVVPDKRVQLGSDSSFPCRALSPHARGRRLFTESEEEPAETRVLLADLLLSACRTLVVLPLRGDPPPTGCSRVTSTAALRVSGHGSAGRFIRAAGAAAGRSHQRLT